MKRAVIACCALALSAACTSTAKISSDGPVSPEPSSSSFNAAAAQACQAADTFAALVHGTITLTQLSTFANVKAEMLKSGDTNLSEFTLGNDAFDIPTLRALLGKCVELGYLTAVRTIDDTQPSPPATTAGKTLVFTRGGSPVIMIAAGPSRAFDELGYLRPSRGHFVALVIRAEASATTIINPLDFYARGLDGSHYGVTFVNVGDPPALNAVTLNPGEQTNGSLVFDVPFTSGFTLVYAPAEKIAGTWAY